MFLIENIFNDHQNLYYKMTKNTGDIEVSELIQILRNQLNNLPDCRVGKNKKYELSDVVLAAFSVFFTQSPSFLEHQRFMNKKKGKDNALSLFSLTEIPSDNQIRKLLDPIPAQKIFDAFTITHQRFNKSKIINQFKYFNNQILVALDGTEYFTSQKIFCPNCNCREHKNGTKTYYHQVIMQVLVSPEKTQVINFAPEFIKKQDGNCKQDCENNAIKRWLLSNPIDKKKDEITLLGDDLYSRQPICKLALAQGYNFIFVAKPTSHQTLYEWVEYLEKNGEVNSYQYKKYEKGKKLIYHCRYINNIPLREKEPSLFVNWYEVEIKEEGKDKVIYHNSFITNHELKDEIIDKLISSGRTRWKVENEGYNILKNQGYNLEHNFGHGQNNLSEILLSLNLLAFLFHNILDLVNIEYQQTRLSLGTRKSFFNDIKALLKYIYFKSWSELFIFIITEGESKETIDTS